MEEFYTVEEVAERLKVTPRTVREWLRTKRLKAGKAGRQWRIHETDLQAFMAHGRPETQEEGAPDDR
jgi:excisionase family DNA binding protein